MKVLKSLRRVQDWRAACAKRIYSRKLGNWEPTLFNTVALGSLVYQPFLLGRL